MCCSRKSMKKLLSEEEYDRIFEEEGDEISMIWTSTPIADEAETSYHYLRDLIRQINALIEDIRCLDPDFNEIETHDLDGLANECPLPSDYMGMTPEEVIEWYNLHINEASATITHLEYIFQELIRERY